MKDIVDDRRKSQRISILVKSLSNRKNSINQMNLFFNSNKKKKNINEIIETYSINSLFCLSKDNKIRIFFIIMIENRWFDLFILCTIFLSTITMLLYNYYSILCENIENESKKENCKILYEQEIYRDQILDKIFIFYNIIFTIEMMSKIIAKGLILHKFSYLRSGWNIFDAFITTYSLIEVFMPILNTTNKTMSAMRTIRLLRVFKEVVNNEGIRRIISAIIFSLPTMINVILFLGFVFIVFATFGIQLFTGVFYTRCRAEPFQINETFWSAPPIYDRICSKPDGPGMFKCPENLHCVNFYEIPNYFNLSDKQNKFNANITIEMFDINEEKLNENPYFFYGVPNFDNILFCLINVFCFMTYQNWSEIYSILIDGVSPIVCQIFFNLVIIVGGFFIMKLILAALNEALIKVRRDEIGDKIMLKRENLNNGEEKIRENLINLISRFNVDEDLMEQNLEDLDDKNIKKNADFDKYNRNKKNSIIDSNITVDENKLEKKFNLNPINPYIDNYLNHTDANIKRNSKIERDLQKTKKLNLSSFCNIKKFPDKIIDNIKDVADEEDDKNKNKYLNKNYFDENLKIKESSLSKSDSNDIISINSDDSNYSNKNDIKNTKIKNFKNNFIKPSIKSLEKPHHNNKLSTFKINNNKLKEEYQNESSFNDSFNNNNSYSINSSLMGLNPHANPVLNKNKNRNYIYNLHNLNNISTEKISYQQNRNIIIIENLEFEHSCDKIKNIIKNLEESNPKEKIDNFLNNYTELINQNSSHPNNNNNYSFYNNLLNQNFSSTFQIKNKLQNQNFNLFTGFLNNKLDTVKQMAVEKIKYLILEEHSHTKQYIIFNLFIYSVTFLNLFYLSRMSYPMSENTSKEIKFVNIFCSSVFILEIIFKLLVLGLKGFFNDKLNLMDFIVVNIGVIEIIAFRITNDPKDDINSSLSSFRALRFIRLLKLFKKGFIQRFVNFIIISLRDLLYYCFLLLFFIVLFTIIGRELFANKIKILNKMDEYGYIYLEGENMSPRENFDTIFNSFLTVFILFIGDNWPKIMYEYARLYYTQAFGFFIFVIILGNIMLFNLFLSILMTNYDTEYAEEILNLDENKNDGIGKNIKKLEQTVKGVYSKLRQFYKKILYCCGDTEDDVNFMSPNKNSSSINSINNFKKRKVILPGSMFITQDNTNKKNNNNSSPNNNNISGNNLLEEKINIAKIKDLIPMIRKSLFIFPKHSKFREWCHKISTKSKIFEYFIMINIIISLIILALDTPLLTDTTMKKILYIFDVITTFSFIIEMGLKIVAFGFLLNGKYSYIRYGFNILDFGQICLSLSYLIVTSYSIFNIEGVNNINNNLIDSTNISFTSRTSSTQKVFRIVKILRILRVFKLIERSKSLQATLSAFYNSLKQMMTIIIICCIFIFMFSIIGVTYFRGLFHRCDFSKVPVNFIYKINNKWDCIDYGGDWINPYPNFDNVNTSFILLFEMMTTEGWTYYMYSAVDSTEINLQPIKNNRAIWSLFFILYMVFAYFFLLNSAISILSDNFKKEKAIIENSEFKIPIQIEFFKIFKNLYLEKVPKIVTKSDKISKILLNILDSVYFDVIISACIISNLGILMLNIPGNVERTKGFISYMNSIFSYVFIFEAALKIFVFRINYFSSGWNILDFILVMDTFVNLVLKQLITLFNQVFDSSILRAIRVVRILRILKKAKSLNRIFNLFLNSIPGVINSGILYFIFLYIYGVVGMGIFSYIKHQNIISEKWNFQDFPSSLLILIRLTTGEGWNIVMKECFMERSVGYYCKYYEEMSEEEILSGNIGCGTNLAIPFFMSFIILSTMMFLQFFSVIIASTVNDTYVINLEELKKAQLNKFKRKWANYDKEGTGFISVDNFQKFLFEIGYPFGISSMKITDYLKVISILDIFTYDDKKFIFFYDVITELTKYFLIHKYIDEEYGDGKLFQNVEKTVEEKSLFFEVLNSDISELKQNVKMMILNPYYNNEKYNKVIKDKLQLRVKFSKSENLKLHYAWAIKKISRFTRIYNHMKTKCLKLIEKDMIVDEVFLFSVHFYDKILNKCNNNDGNNFGIIPEIEEGNSLSSSGDNSNSNSKSSSSSNNKSFNKNSVISINTFRNLNNISNKNKFANKSINRNIINKNNSYNEIESASKYMSNNTLITKNNISNEKESSSKNIFQYGDSNDSNHFNENLENSNDNDNLTSFNKINNKISLYSGNSNLYQNFPIGNTPILNSLIKKKMSIKSNKVSNFNTE